jgi:hypothetical protein
VVLRSSLLSETVSDYSGNGLISIYSWTPDIHYFF